MERLEGERRVAHPRVAVVPVALAARGLGERCRQRRDGRPGRHVGQPLDREGRPLDRVAPAMVGDAGSAEPRAPEAHRRGEPGLGLLDVLRASQPLRPGQGAVRLVTRLQDVPCPHAPALDAEREICSEADRLPRSRRVGHVPIALDQRPRRLLATVAEDGLADQLDLDVSFEALDGAHEHVVGVVVGRRARVGRDLVLVVPRAHGQRGTDDDPAARRLPGRLEDVRPRLVHARRRMVDRERRQAERARPAVEQAPEHARRVEARNAQPVDRTVRGHQRSGVAIGDERVVGDGGERRRSRRALCSLLLRLGRAAHDSSQGSRQRP